MIIYFALSLFFFVAGLYAHKIFTKNTSETTGIVSKEHIDSEEDISSPNEPTRKVNLLDFQDLLELDREEIEAEPAPMIYAIELERAEQTIEDLNQTIEHLNKIIESLEVKNKVNELTIKELRKRIEIMPSYSKQDDLMLN